MNRRMQIRWKLIIIFVLAALLAFLLFFYKERSEPEYVGEMVFTGDMQILTDKSAELLKTDPEAVREEIGEYTKEEDWYEAFDQFLTYHELDRQICKETIGIIGGKDFVHKPELAKGQVLTVDGTVYSYVSNGFDQLSYRNVVAYRMENTLLAIREKLSDPVVFREAYLEEADESGIQFFYRGCGLYHPCAQKQGAEQIVTLAFQGEELVSYEEDGEIISGKTLQVTEQAVTLEEQGTIPFGEVCEGYYQKEEVRSSNMDEIPIGYAFTDYLIKDGKICAFLILPKEQMEYIRVAIQQSDYRGLYHKEIILQSSEELTLSYLENGEKKEEPLPAGKKLVLSQDTDYLKEGMLKVVNPTNSGKTDLLSVHRNQGVPSYRGNFEIHKTEEGLLLINELLLEEYLYAVVPSEMPSTYPAESLKAQAVCARTYSYGYLDHAGLPALGAHVDDSVNYQVYNNIMEKKSSTDAVRQTGGELLLQDGKPITAYYYSTSCGYGTDDRIWKEQGDSAAPYLRSVHIAREDSQKNLEQKTNEDTDNKLNDLIQEETLRDYLTAVHEEDYEKEEPWYRWSYTVKDIDIDLLKKKLQERGISFTDFKKVKDMEITRRAAGGSAGALVITTDQGEIPVEEEYEIRYVLNQGGGVIRQDGSAYELSTILPSAYFVIDLQKGKKGITGFTLSGGGFGHGVGMSQNAAKAMAQSGKTYEEILAMFYRNCQLAKKY
ncbi:MAG: SpoIID/LytB domain-containing protein [Lachnospiraceae bacterium]|nr:SpoIID/LytB domain-containing protein [Lachnospiraceae bacterium]